jgi:alkane 1-monooxygenase
MQNKQVFTSFYFYLASYIFGILALLSAEIQGVSFYIAPITAFGIIPILELFLKPSKARFNIKHPIFNQIAVVLIAPFHYFILIKYLILFSSIHFNSYEWIGAIFTVGLLCGVYGINVAHELGHRKSRWLQLIAQSLLLTSLYQHFFIEHNRGHHKRVGTLADPATARLNESVYAFWVRCIWFSWISAFKLEKQRLELKNISWFTYKNQFLRFMILEGLTLVLIGYFLGSSALLFFVISALVGIILLESINYIEHYGLFRKEISNGVFEQVQAKHSWNSDHVLGRFLLFELSRHSHHHENASRHYYELESMDHSKQLPVGYPGSILLALIPPMFFRVMNKRIKD